VLNPAKFETVPMPDGKWPTEGPVSLAAFKKTQSEISIKN
jgi:hypothetical protein